MVFVFELNWKPANELQKTIFKNFDVEFSRLLIKVDDFDISPDILTFKIYGCFPMGWRSSQILFYPLLWSMIIVPAIVIL